MHINNQIKIFIQSLRTGVLRFFLIMLMSVFGVIYSDTDLVKLSTVQGNVLAGQKIRSFPKNEKDLVSVKIKNGASQKNGFTVVETFQVPLFAEGKPALVWSGLASAQYCITQDFGYRGHFGQDFGLTGNPNPGYEVRPVAEGKVVYAGWTGADSWGFAVLIKHLLRDGRFYYSQYGHLYDFPAVQAGQMVTKDTFLGYVGDTGRSFGPHLDLQIKEIPYLSGKAEEEGTIYDLGFGYSESNEAFGGASVQDSRTGQIYYRPSYFVFNYNSKKEGPAS